MSRYFHELTGPSVEIRDRFGETVTQSFFLEAHLYRRFGREVVYVYAALLPLFGIAPPKLGGLYCEHVLDRREVLMATFDGVSFLRQETKPFIVVM